MKFNDLEVLKAGYENLHDRIIPVMLRTDKEKLRPRLIPTINPIIWMAWHMLRIEDMFLSDVIFRQKQIFHSDNWQRILQIETTHVGTGMEKTEADELAKQIDLEGLRSYNLAVKQHTNDLLDLVTSWPSEKLDAEEVIEARLRASGAFPDGVLEDRVKAYAPSPMSACLLGLLNHAYMHFGQYLSIMKPL